MENKHWLEEGNTKKIFPIGTDLNTAAITGARIAMKNFHSVLALLMMESSTAAVVQVTLKQHTAISGGTSKVLATLNPYFHKISTAEVYTKVDQTVAASLIDASTVFAAAAGELAIPVCAEDLDQDGGYSFFSIDIADSTAAKVAAGEYLLDNSTFEPGYAQTAVV